MQRSWELYNDKDVVGTASRKVSKLELSLRSQHCHCTHNLQANPSESR